MKKNRMYVPMLGLLLLAGACQTNMEYDISNGLLDKEVTLFENELVVPVGSAGPFCLDLLIGQLSSFLADLGLPKDIVSVGEDGNLLMKAGVNVYDENFYRLAIRNGDNDEPYIWEPGDEDMSPALSTLLPMVGVTLHNQSFILEASSPLRTAVPMSGKITLKCSSGEETSFQKEVVLQDFSLPRSGESVVLAEFQVPEAYTDHDTKILLIEPKVTLPEHFGKQVSGEGNFSCILTQKVNISLGDKFSLPLPLDLKVNLPLSKAHLRAATVTMALENTLPLNLEVQQVNALDADGKEVSNIEIVPDIRLAGGSVGAPSTSLIALGIKTKDGSEIPDIKRISIKLKASSAPGLGNVLLSAKQGVSVNYSTIKINGGITLFRNEN